ncbi:MAG: universal stress protein [Polyangiales bacterium]
MLTLRHILVPVDFSHCSSRAVELAAELAARFGAQIDLLHVWHLPPLVSPGEVAEGAGLSMKMLDSLSDHAYTQLARFAADVRAKGIALHQTRAIAGASVHETIVDDARRGAYDLVVIGSHGRSGLARFALGSVAERVVRHAPCPVLVARAEPGVAREARPQAAARLVES